MKRDSSKNSHLLLVCAAKSIIILLDTDLGIAKKLADNAEIALFEEVLLSTAAVSVSSAEVT